MKGISKNKEKQFKARIKRLDYENICLFCEMAERGKALEKIRKIIDGCKELMPKEIHKKLHTIVYEYVERCNK